MQNTQETISYDASSALELTSSAQKALADATSYVIEDQFMFEIAGDDLRRIKGLQKEVEEKRTRITGPLNQAVKAVNDLFRTPKEYLEKAESTLKRSMMAYESEQKRKAAEARAQAEAAARAERERLAAIEREQKEAARRAEAEALAAAKGGDLVASAKANQEAKAAQVQAEIASANAQIVTITPEIEAPARVSGISGRVTYSAEITDLILLVQAVASGAAPVECLQADVKFLNAQARAYKKPGQIFPGVICVEEKSISARSY